MGKVDKNIIKILREGLLDSKNKYLEAIGDKLTEKERIDRCVILLDFICFMFPETKVGERQITNAKQSV